MMLYKLLAHMHREEFEQAVASLTPGGATGPLIAGLGIPVHDLGMRRGVPSPSGLLRLIRLLREWRPHVLQTWLYHADLLGTVAARAGSRPVLAWNVRCSKMDARYESGLGGLMLRLLARLSTKPEVVVVNSAAGEELHRSLGYAPRRWAMLPNGFDTGAFAPDTERRLAARAALGVQPGQSAIGLIARYDPIKDHATFLRAGARALASRQDLVFVLAGPGVDRDNRELRELVEALNLQNQTLLLGARTDVAALNAALDIASCTSLGEGFPNTIGEAMATGVPVVMTDVGDAREIVGPAGLIVPPRDPDDLARAWLSLLDLPAEERLRLGRLARERIVARFDIRQIARLYEDLYRDLAAKRFPD